MYTWNVAILRISVMFTSIYHYMKYMHMEKHLKICQFTLHVQDKRQ